MSAEFVNRSLRRLESQIKDFDPLHRSLALWLGVEMLVEYGPTPVIWTPRDVACRGFLDAAKRSPTVEFRQGLYWLMKRAFFVPHTPPGFEADPLAILGVAAGIERLADPEATTWICGIINRAFQNEFDVWRISLLRAALAISGRPQHLELVPEMADVLVARGVSGVVAPDVDRLIGECVSSGDISPDRAVCRLASLRRMVKAQSLEHFNALRGGSRMDRSKERESSDKVDVGIITIKDEEFASALVHFGGNLTALNKRNRTYDVATIDATGGSVRVAIIRCLLQGNVHAQQMATELIEDVSPAFVVALGIGGGIPTPDFTLGDVIISSYIHDLTLEESNPGKPKFNASGGPLHKEAVRIVGRLKALVPEHRNWQSTVQLKRPPFEGEPTTSDKRWNKQIEESFNHHQLVLRDQSIFRSERIASSDRLIKDPDLIKCWRSVIKGIAAVEMESAGVYAACSSKNVPFFAVRGISDIVGWKRDERWTLYACESAAAFARALIETGEMRLQADHAC